MKRRAFLKSSLAAGGVALAAPRSLGEVAVSNESAGEPFKLKYAPHFGMFKHHAGEDPLDQLRFMADQGFRALEDNGMKSRPPEIQERIGAELQRLGMEMGVFVCHYSMNPTWVKPLAEAREFIDRDVKSSIEVAERVGARWCTVVPGGYLTGQEWDYQTANVIDNLRHACELLEESGLVMVLEPLNHWVNHAGCFLSKVPQAFLICRAVNHPCCKILDDLYHQQIHEGNLTGNLDLAWSEIAYIQVGDHPGRNEPTTGEINYKHLFRHLHRKGYQGIVGMEHGLSKGGKEGEEALIRAYREVDSFET